MIASNQISLLWQSDFFCETPDPPLNLKMSASSNNWNNYYPGFNIYQTPIKTVDL
jgi:hypothetical protein